MLLFILLLFLGIPFIAALCWVVYWMVQAGTPSNDLPPAPVEWPSVSVIVPAHNEAERLAETLASLEQITYPGSLEFMLVNDRSTDDTAAIMEQFHARDTRFRVLNITEPSKRMAPKVNAVSHGIANTTGEIIIATDADCRYHPNWVRTLVQQFTDDVVMVSGYVEIDPEKVTSAAQKIEAADWFSLMLTSRSMNAAGNGWASSANNQAYLRSAFETVGGFGTGGKAPSGDEDILAQRLAGIPGAKTVLTTHPDARVYTSPMPTAYAFVRQRRRWVSRYHHPIHYDFWFLASIVTLGTESVVLVLSLIFGMFNPALLTAALIIYAMQTTVHVTGMNIGARQLQTPYFGGWRALCWALLHPFLIGTVSVWSFIKPGAWYAGARDYRKTLIRRRLRVLKRALTSIVKTPPTV